MARWLAGFLAVAAILWGGWWFVGRAAVLRGADVAVAELRARGWDVAYDDLSVAGFPSRFDATLDAPAVTSPGGAVTIAAPFFQVFALSYRPNHLIAVAPHAMRVDLPGVTVAVASEDLRGSAVLTASTAPELVRATVVARALRLDAEALGAEMGSGQVAIRRVAADVPEGEAAADAPGSSGAPDAPETEVWDVAVSLAGIRLSPALHAALDPQRVLPDAIDLVELDAVVTRMPDGDPQGLDLRRASIGWGGTRAVVTGAARIGADGAPEGTFALDLTGWEAAFDLAVSRGLVPEGRAPLIRAGLAGMAAADGTVRAELTLAGGQMRLGPIPLGPVPGF